MTDKQINKYIRDYNLGNLKISKGGNFEDFLNLLITFYSEIKESEYKRED